MFLCRKLVLPGVMLVIAGLRLVLEPVNSSFLHLYCLDVAIFNPCGSLEHEVYLLAVCGSKTKFCTTSMMFHVHTWCKAVIPMSC